MEFWQSEGCKAVTWKGSQHGIGCLDCHGTGPPGLPWVGLRVDQLDKEEQTNLLWFVLTSLHSDVF